MTPFFRLLRYARPYRGRLVSALVAMVVYGLSQAGIAALIKPIFDEVLPTGRSLGLVAGAVLGLYLLKGVGAYLSSLWMTEVGQRVVHDLRRTLFRHILDQSAAYFSGQTTGRLMSRLTNDVAQVQFAVSETIGDLTRESLAIVGYAAVLIYVDARLALVCLTGAPLVVYPLVRLGQRVRRTTRRSQEALEHMAHVSAEAFAGHRIVKAFGAEAREAEKFERASERYYRTNMKVTSALSVLPPLMELIGGVAFVAALWYGSQEITAGRLTSGDFVAFIAALFLMYGPAKKLSRVNASLQQAMAATERIFEVLDTHSEVTDRPDAVPMTGLRHGLEFRDVRFAYAGPEQPTLDGVTFEVPVGADAGAGGPERRRQDHRDEPAGAVLRPHVGRRPVRRARHPRADAARPCARTSAWSRRRPCSSTTPWPPTSPTASPDATREEIEAAARAAHADEFISRDGSAATTR